MYEYIGNDKSSSNISKISSINKYERGSSANKKKALWCKIENICQQNINDNSYRCGKC